MAQPPKPKYLELSEADLQKANRSRANREAVQIDDYQLIIAEFGKHYGYEGIKAILNNEIDSDTVAWLILAARKVDNKRLYQNSQAAFIGSAASKAKKPAHAFRKATEKILKLSKADV